MTTGQAVMLVGPAGTGKTQLIMGALRNLTNKAGNDYLTSKINMNFYTRSDSRSPTRHEFRASNFVLCRCFGMVKELRSHGGVQFLGG